MTSRRRRSRAEDGFVMIVVLVLVLIGLLVATAAVTGALVTRQTATHQARVGRAQQAADAGVRRLIYDQSDANVAASYNFTGGPLGLSGFVDCIVPQFNVSLQLTGLSAYASSAGICPLGLNSGGSPITSNSWTSLDNHDYYEAEVLSNKKELGGSGYGSVVEFPQIVSIGCDTSTPSSCNTTPAPSSNVYSRELAILSPTGPLQAIEGMGDVKVNGLSALGLGAVVINGDLSAGGQLTWPTIAAAVNVTNSSIAATFAATSFNPNNGGTTAKEVTLSGSCSANAPSTTCYIQRPAPQVSVTSCSACSAGITCSSCGTGGYNSTNDTFSLTTGTATFAAGDYVFCNFNASGGTINTSPSSTTPVRIFILPPNKAPCNGYGLSQAGDFTASQGVNNVLTGTVNGVTGVLDPSALQIYVAGDGSYDNNTTVSIGDSSSCTSHNLLGVCLTATAPTEAMVVYAPTSQVTMNTGTCVVGLLGSCVLGVAGTFDGSLIGDNVSITASVISQDLDIGNYPLETGANFYRVEQYIECDTSVTALTNAGSDTSGC
jgi:Tfp pilus assembly protein PilX